MEENNEFNKYEEKAQKFHDEHKSEAEGILHDPDKMEQFLQRLEDKIKGMPHLGNALGDLFSYVRIMMSLVKSYVKGEYKGIPLSSMIAIVLALLYFVLPVDFIPDFLGIVGYIDDAAVIAICLYFIESDLRGYCNWRKENGREIGDLPESSELTKKVMVFLRPWLRPVSALLGQDPAGDNKPKA